MTGLFERIRQLVCPRRVWIAYHIDFSGFALFDEELPARRYAAENNMSVDWVPFGTDARMAILNK